MKVYKVIKLQLENFLLSTFYFLLAAKPEVQRGV